MNYKFKVSRYNQTTPRFHLRKFQPEYDTFKSKDESIDFEKLITNYISNLRLIKSFCVEFEKKCKFILQPNYSFKDEDYKNQYEINYHSDVAFENYELMEKKFFLAAKKEFSKLNNIDENILFHDMSSLFEYEKELTFFDLIHYTRYANQKISNEIAKLILK